MIDKSNEIFALIAKRLKKDFPDLTVIGESVDKPTKFPTVTVDEISNLPTEIDSSEMNKYAVVRYRVQVFTTNTRKRAEARMIYSVVDEVLQGVNLNCKVFSTTPEVYNSKVYQITATHEGVIHESGVIFRSK